MYLAALLRAMAARCQVDLVSMCRPSEIGAARELTWFSSVETVVVPRVADQTRTGRALDQVRHAYLWGARALPLLAAKMRRPAMTRALDRALDRKPDVALLEFAVMAQYLPGLRRRCATVLTDHERGGHAAAGILGRALGRQRDEGLWRHYVRRFYPLADLLQAVNAEDARSLGRSLGREVGVRPLLVDLPPRAVDVASTPARAVFLGDYSHHPNAEAAAFVAQQVWPLVRAKTPHAELWLAGARAPRSVRQLEQVDGVRFVGFVRDLAELFGDVRLLLSPVLSGEGSRVKVITAAAHGVPVVANALALSGLGLPASAAARGESAAELAALAQVWLEDPVAAGHAGAAARAWAEANLIPDVVVDGQLESLRALLHGWPRS